MLDTIRGADSTGIFSSSKYVEKNEIVKDTGTPFDGILDSKGGKSVFFNNNKLLIGHNRAATKGKVTPENAHPFEHDHIVGVHNGTIRKQHLFLDHTKFEVDSDNLYYNLSKEGLEETLKKTDGAYALVYYDKEQQEVNFVRNNERPLYYMYSEDGKCLFWASEPWMLEVALFKANIKHGQVMQFTALNWYRLSIPTAPQGSRFLPDGILGKFRVKPIKEYEAPPVITYPQKNKWNQHWEEYDDDDPIAKPPFKGNTRVIELVGKKFFSAQDFDGCVGKFLHFEVKSIDGDKEGNIHCETTPTNTGIKIGIPAKLFPPTKNSILWGMFDVGDKFMARVKRVTRISGGAYLLLDIRSLSESGRRQIKKEIEEGSYDPNEEDMPDPLVEVGTEKKAVTSRELRKLMQDGCVMCTGPLHPGHEDTFGWLHNGLLCLDCRVHHEGKEAEKKNYTEVLLH